MNRCPYFHNTVVFTDGTRIPFVHGNAIDFIKFPDGKNKNDIKDVFPHKGRNEKNLVQGPDYYWCLYSK